MALTEGEDYYYNEDGFMVFTESYHLRRGYCCNSNCKHCPYNQKDEKSSEQNDQEDKS